mmetsp:Transcript_4152/g.10553  ORF Transcript_4152/g.10553 Transcript_4152/m.10553 type:complete len:107 (-) Transcript_4152:214-534(-)
MLVHAIGSLRPAGIDQGHARHRITCRGKVRGELKEGRASNDASIARIETRQKPTHPARACIFSRGLPSLVHACHHQIQENHALNVVDIGITPTLKFCYPSQDVAIP